MTIGCASNRALTQCRAGLIYKCGATFGAPNLRCERRERMWPHRLPARGRRCHDDLRLPAPPGVWVQDGTLGSAPEQRSIASSQTRGGRDHSGAQGLLRLEFAELVTIRNTGVVFSIGSVFIARLDALFPALHLPRLTASWCAHAPRPVPRTSQGDFTDPAGPKAAAGHLEGSLGETSWLTVPALMAQELRVGVKAPGLPRGKPPSCRRRENSPLKGPSPVGPAFDHQTSRSRARAPGPA